VSLGRVPIVQDLGGGSGKGMWEGKVERLANEQ